MALYTALHSNRVVLPRNYFEMMSLSLSLSTELTDAIRSNNGRTRGDRTNHRHPPTVVDGLLHYSGDFKWPVQVAFHVTVDTRDIILPDKITQASIFQRNDGYRARNLRSLLPFLADTFYH